MATCARETGFLFWKKRCDGPSIGPCDQCRLFICQHHGNIQGDGGMLCNRCAHVEDDSSDSSGSWFSSGSSSEGSSTFSTDSSSESSASSDSGGGGDGGSGGD